MRSFQFQLSIALSLTILAATQGCLPLTANKIVQAPNRRHALSSGAAQTAEVLRSRSFQFMSGHPQVPIEASVIEPGDYAFRYDFKRTVSPDGSGHAAVHFKYTISDKVPDTQASKGTILLLHGILLSKESMLPWGFSFAQAGFRVVLVDLRGHGHSGGQWIGFGAFELYDLKALLDQLQVRGLIQGKLGVLGISYGGSIGLQLAGTDERVGAVVALAPFSDPRRGTLQFLRGSQPGLAGNWREDEFFKALEGPAHRAGFAWEDINVPAAVSRIKVPILLFHGQKDSWVPPEHSKVLADHGSAVTLRLLDDCDHVTLGLMPDNVIQEAEAFFNQHLPTSPPPE